MSEYTADDRDLLIDDDGHDGADDWYVMVSIPRRVGWEVYERLSNAVADAAWEAQPDERDWDVFVHGQGPRPAEADSPAPCDTYSNGADGWCCAATGPHDEHRNAAGDVRWGDV